MEVYKANMRIIKPGYEIISDINGKEILQTIEKIGRVCYKSETAITEESYKNFIQNILKRGHESVIEHEKITVKFICDRGVSHEIVRHRIASYSQESTRYCNYCNDQFGKELTVIKPCFWEENSQHYQMWVRMMSEIEKCYNALIENGAKPEEARSILPNSLKTEIVVTMNLREWRHFFTLRTSRGAHPQMREIAIALLERFKDEIPLIFDDIVPLS